MHNYDTLFILFLMTQSPLIVPQHNFVKTHIPPASSSVCFRTVSQTDFTDISDIKHSTHLSLNHGIKDVSYVFFNQDKNLQ